jgi:hypothetical protein
LDNGTGIFAKTKLANKILKSDADIQRQKTTSKDLGRGTGDTLPNAEDPAKQTQVVNKEGTDNTSQKLAAQSYYLNAINQTPMSWDRQRGVAQNLIQNLGNVKARGDRSIHEAGSQDRLQNAMNPGRSSQQLLTYLSGERQPIVNHPLDQFIQGGV